MEGSKWSARAIIRCTPRPACGRRVRRCQEYAGSQRRHCNSFVACSVSNTLYFPLPAYSLIRIVRYAALEYPCQVNDDLVAPQVRLDLPELVRLLGDDHDVAAIQHFVDVGAHQSGDVRDFGLDILLIGPEQ